MTSILNLKNGIGGITLYNIVIWFWPLEVREIGKARGIRFKFLCFLLAFFFTEKEKNFVYFVKKEL